jgi:type II secretory pathway component PulC
VQQRLQKLPLYSGLAIAAVLALQVSGLAWSVVHKPGEAASPRALQPGQQAAPLDVGQIMGAHLFGQAEADPTQVAPTSLPLQLVGTWADADPQQGMAFVREGEGGPQQLYRVGQSLPGGGVLREVYARSIVFERDGRNEELSFPQIRLQYAERASLGGLLAANDDDLGGLHTAEEQAEAERGVPQWRHPPDQPGRGDAAQAENFPER